MATLFICIVVVVLCFGLVVLVGAPYLPTLDRQVKVALDLVDLQPGQTLLELGSGDGKVLIAAAKRGWNVVGYELNPILVLVSWARTRGYRHQVKIVWGNFWNDTKWPPAEGIFGFILPKYMQKLDTKVMHWHTKPVKVVSFAFAIPDKAPTEQRHGVFLYDYV